MTRLMRVLYGALAAVFTLAAISTESFGQSVLLQGGPFTAGHQPIYSGTGSSQPIMIDGGSAAGGGVGANPSTLGITSRGTGTAPYASQGQGQLGTNFCMYDAPITNATGYHYLCLDANAQGGGLFTYGAGGGAADLTLSFIVNGITYTFPFSGSGGSCLTCITSSVSLTAGFPIIGNGSLTAALGGRSGNTTTYVTTTGAQTSGDCVSIDANGNHIASGVACAGGGGVASVSLAAPGGFSVTGSPCASTCTLAIAANGISGGIPYYSATNTMASSGALTANLPVIGGGAGAAPTVGTRSGNTTQFVTTTGAQTSGNCVSIDASGNHVATGTACGASSGITVGTTTIAAGTTGRFLYDNGGVVGEYAMPLPVANGGTGISGGTSGGIPYFSATTTIASSGALTANLPVIGGGAGSAPTVGSRSGNTTAFVTTTGTQTSGNCVSIDASGNHIANGAACAVSGALPSLSNGSIWVGDGTNTAVAVTISGDITMTNAGVTAIGAGKVTNAMLAGSITASKLIGTDIATVGTITTGTWNAGAVSAAGAITGTSSSASALAVGRLGATTPALQVDASTGTSITGLKVKAAATTGGVDLTAIGETNVNLRIDAAGSGTLTLNNTATGSIFMGRQVRANVSNTTNPAYAGISNLSGVDVGTTGRVSLIANSVEQLRADSSTLLTALSSFSAQSTFNSNVTRTIASANLQAGTAGWADVEVINTTTTLSGSTNITSFLIAKTQLDVPVLTASASAITITHAATFYIGGAPTTSSSGGFTPVITNPWAFWLQSGAAHFGANVDFVGAIGVGVTSSLSGTKWIGIAAGATGYSQINFAASTAPTSPNDGDLWFETGSCLKLRVSGANTSLCGGGSSTGAPYVGGSLGGVIAASPTISYVGPGDGAASNSASGTEADHQASVTRTGTAKNLTIVTRAAQSGTGSLVAVLRKNGVDTALTLTISAGAAAGTFSDTTHTVSFTQLDLLSLKLTNNASATGPGLNFSVEYD